MNRSLICLALISIALGAGCFTWECGTIDAVDSCLHLNGSIVTVQQCPKGQICSSIVEADTDPTEIINLLKNGDVKCKDKPAPEVRTG